MPIMTNVLRSLGNLSLSPGTDLDTGQMKSRTWTLLPEMWSEQKAMVYSLPNGNRKNISSQLFLHEAEMGILEDTEVFTQTPLKILPTLVPIGYQNQKRGLLYDLWVAHNIANLFGSIN